MSFESATNKIETCACCGKDVKKPVTIKRFPGQFFGKNCADDITYVRSRLRDADFCPAESRSEMREKIVAIIKRDWPRTGDKLIAWAGR